ncbi:hypothetical protein OUY22_24695 [Nonomuraea sp. MCN248]|uniref:Uncharacterized protein n=1 Tax=Nonomuraea corallina TaxID=2989783 RepID=A0ABT4SHE1_9ACTN|nr:hypothetical protein [Nonomuraea corallina]MDA0636623.1 hypothetical protein [Nonomuraea corallina]
MTGEFRPARAIEPGWHVRLAAGDTPDGGGWMPVQARIDTVDHLGRQRIWFLGDDRAAMAYADDLVFSRTPEEAALAHHP